MIKHKIILNSAALLLILLTIQAGNVASAQTELPQESEAKSTFTLNPEFEAIISEAKKQGKHSMEIAMAMKQDGRYTFAQFREFSKYVGNKTKIEQAEVDKKIADGKIQLTDAANRLIEIITDLKKAGKFTQKEADLLIEIYNTPIQSPETKKLIKERFPDLFPLK